MAEMTANEKDNAFPVVLNSNESIEHYGLTKLEYAAIQIAAGDKTLTASKAVKIAKEILRECNNG